MNAAGNVTMEYDFDRGIWGRISFVVTTRGNHGGRIARAREFGAERENFEDLEPLDCRKRRFQSLNFTFFFIIIIVKQKPICSYKAELLGLHPLKYGL